MLVPPAIPSSEEKKTQKDEQKRVMKAKKGQLSVRVGLEEKGEGEQKGNNNNNNNKNGSSDQRFDMPIWYLCHPLFEPLLEKAQEVYGYDMSGPLRLPCSADEFLRLRSRIEKESNLHLPYPHPPQLKYLA